MTIDLSELRKLAEAALPGPWMRNHMYACVHTHNSELRRVCNDPNNNADIPTMEYIAAANPATVLALIGAVEAMRDALVEIAHDMQPGMHRELAGKALEEAT